MYNNYRIYPIIQGGAIMENFTVDFFYLDSGECPVKEFLNSTHKKMRAKIVRSIALLENNGNMLGMPYSEHLEEGIYELRVKQGSDITRIMYFFCKGKIIILTHGFTKKTNKTPPNEIETAKKYRDIYFSRQEEC